MNKKLRNAVLALAMLLPLTMNGQNNNDGHQLPQRKSVTFPASDIQYWVGTGSNSAVVIIGWDDNPSGNNFALAWGVHWNGSATAANMLDTIATYDSRTSYPGISSGWMNGFYYDDGTLVSGSSASYWCYTINGGYAGAYGSQAMADGDVMEISSSCMFTLTTATAATNPNSDPGTTPADTVDATIAFGDILYWVGSGTDSAAFIVNYAQPDTAFAWGYLFNGSTTAEAMVNAIAAADPRFEVVGSPSMGGDLHFVTAEGDTLGLSPADPAMGYNFWWTNLNGVSADAGASSTLHNGYVFKYGDLNSAHGWDFQSGYYMQEAWPTTPTPVPVPQVTPDPVVCDSLPLPYSDDFSGYVSNQSIRAHMAGARMPDCWTMVGSGTTQYVDSPNSTNSVYFGGVAYSTSTNSFGAVSANDAYFCLIASQIYTGTNSSHIADMNATGTRRYAMLPSFEQPLSQTVLTFDHRTSGNGAQLVVGYVLADTTSFVGLDTMLADNRVLHHDTIRFADYAGMPDDARLAFLWQVTSTTASTTGPGNRYCGIDNLTVALDTTAAPVTPAPEDAAIAAADILFWVGEGQNEVVFAVNWADTALAWGYRFQSDSMLVGNIVDAIATADPRLSYVGSPAYISDFLYADSLITDTLRLTPHDPYDYSIYFSMSVNHVASMLGAGQHKVVNGDFVKFADTYAAIKVDSTWIADYSYWDYTYVWPMAIHAVSVPDTTGSTPEPPTPPQPGSFCGAVGTEGCTAIKADSSAFVAWATGVTVTRGPRKISDPSLGVAATGTESNAVGQATLNNVYDVVSLGDGGTALVTFALPITNGDGPDFAVFENGFSDNSLELAFVEVSTDGQRFVRFPATCLTQNTTQLGNAGQSDPTNLNNLAGKYRIGYGTPFDLEELRDSTGINIDSIVYVRIVDVVGCIDPQYATRDQYGNIINDPWPTPFESSGYDLTGVGVIHELTPGVGINEAVAVVDNIYPNPTTGRITVSTRRSAEATLFDISGRSVAVYSLNAGTNVLDLTAFQNGVYMLRVDGAVSKIVKK